MITCGNCKGKHADAVEVRKCHAGGKVEGVPEGKVPYTQQTASDKQVKFITSLLKDRIGGAMSRVVVPEVVALYEKAKAWSEIPEDERTAPFPLTRADATKVINGLLGCPPRPNDAWPMVPAGKYVIKGRDGISMYYEVSKPESGRWAGFSFLSQLTGRPGDWGRTKVRDQKQDTVMRAIAADVVGAARAFGDKFCICGRCESPLTNIRSRAAGFGATCAKKLGWPYPSKAEAQVMLNERGLTMPNKDEVAILESYAEQATLDEAPEWAMS